MSSPSLDNFKKLLSTFVLAISFTDFMFMLCFQLLLFVSSAHFMSFYIFFRVKRFLALMKRRSISANVMLCNMAHKYLDLIVH